MSTDAELAELVGRRADARLLGAGHELLPDEVGRPPAIVRDPRRAPVVAVGATLTGLSLVGGLALLIAGVVMLITGSSAGTWAPLLVLGGALVGTHWGWVHVAEFSATRLESSHQRGPLAAQQEWLEAIEPYTRWTVRSDVEDDGTIAIERYCHRPVPVGADRFTFERELEGRDLLDPDSPGALVAERAELVRRQAASDTDRERLRYEAALAAWREAALRHEDERERRSAARAASQALSDSINRNLREPPLV